MAGAPTGRCGRRVASFGGDVERERQREGAVVGESAVVSRWTVPLWNPASRPALVRVSGSEWRQFNHRLAALREREQVDRARFGAHRGPRRRQQRHDLPLERGRHPPRPSASGRGQSRATGLSSASDGWSETYRTSRTSQQQPAAVQPPRASTQVHSMPRQRPYRPRRARRPKAAEEATAGDELSLVGAAHRAAADERRPAAPSTNESLWRKETPRNCAEAAAARPGGRAVVAHVAGEDVDGRRVGGSGGKFETPGRALASSISVRTASVIRAG